METCFEIGLSAEKQFAKHIEGPRFATKEEDILEHWDVKSVAGTKYDVKAMKKWRRSDAEPTDRIHYVELRNVRGELGWIYGQADYIAFETRAHWIVVPRKKLVHFIEGVTENNERSAKPAVYKLYQREGRKDLMTVVPTMDLLAISEVIINKLKIL
jgi:hypothetical protein